MSGRSRMTSPQLFRLMIETTAGRLLIVSIYSRDPPDLTLAAGLASLVDDRRFVDQSTLRIQGEFEALYGQTIELLDVDLDLDDPITASGVVARTLVELIQLVLPDTNQLPEQRERVEERCRSEWQSIRNRFIDSLNQEGVGQARASGGLTPSLYTYVMTVSAEQRRNRAQALQVFPLLRPLLTTPTYSTIREAIDCGKPLIDELSAFWQVPKAMVKTLRGVERNDLGLMVGRLPLILRLLQEIPPDWWPHTAAAWHLFVSSSHSKGIQAPYYLSP